MAAETQTESLKALLTTWREKAVKADSHDFVFSHTAASTYRECVTELEAALLALGERQETAEPPRWGDVVAAGFALWRELTPFVPSGQLDNNPPARQVIERHIAQAMALRLAAHREGPATADLKGLLIDRDAILRDELRVYLDTLHIGGDNIGDIRRSLFVPWESQWNGWVRDETAHREGRPPAAEKLQRWMVVRKRETDAPEVWIFDRYDEAAMHWDRVQANWTDVYFCPIAYGPEGAGMSGERPTVPSAGHAPASDTPRPAETCECGRALPTMCSGCIVEDYEAAFGHVVSPVSETGQASAWQTIAADGSADNVIASRIGRAWQETYDVVAGDTIDRGLALLRKLKEAGFSVAPLPLAPSEDETTTK